MSDNAYKRSPLANNLIGFGWLLIGLGVFMMFACVLMAAVFDSYLQAIALVFMGAVVLLLVRIIDFVGRSALASEEAAKSAKESADILRQRLRSYDHDSEA